MDSLIGQITDITGVPVGKSITVNIYEPGTVENVTFDVPYETLTAEQQATVENFRALMISLIPSE